MSTALYISTLDSNFLNEHYDMTVDEYTDYVNARVNETDIIAENKKTHVNLYVLPY